MLFRFRTNPACTGHQMCQKLGEANAKNILLMQKTIKKFHLKMAYLNDTIHDHSYHESQKTPIINFQLIDSEALMSQIDIKLSQNNYCQQLQKWLTKGIPARQAPKTRLHQVWNKMFDGAFLANCSMTGNGKAGPKVAFLSYENIMNKCGR
uniref:DUF4806 domain-containing protein n=1 Tax=Anopheles albimanus TaxID=7167 RepID=A0A182FWW1_ANOAL